MENEKNLETYVFQDDDEMFAFKWFWYWHCVARQCDEEHQEKSDHSPFHGGNRLSTEQWPSSILNCQGKIIPFSSEAALQRNKKNIHHPPEK